MLSFLHPGFLYAAAAVSAAVVALHFLVAEQPSAGMLPTARFFPDVNVRATSLAVRLSDVLLMLLRVATLLLIGAAFAQPRVTPSKSAVLRIVAVDVSGAVASAAEAADSATRYTPNAAVILFGSAARELPPGDVPAALAAVRPDSAGKNSGSISSALIAALRAASRIRERADSLQLVIVSPFLAAESDSATLAIRRLWPGRIQLARVSGAAQRTGAKATVEWADSTPSGSWIGRPRRDMVGALAFAGQAVVHPFERRWKLNPGESSVRITGRWVDGEPAIIERETADGCTRSIAVTLPTKGDAILRPSFARFLRDVSAPCYRPDNSILPATALAAIEGGGTLAPTSGIAPGSARMTPVVPWLLGGALVLALLELLLRRTRVRKEDDVDDLHAHRAIGEREGKVA